MDGRPDRPEHGGLAGVSAISSGNVWAVGGVPLLDAQTTLIKQ